MEHKQIIPTLMCRMRSRYTYSTKLNEGRWMAVLWQQYSLQRKHSCKYLQNTPQQSTIVCACEKKHVSVECYFWLFFPPFLTIWTLVTKAAGRLNEVKAIYTDIKICVPLGGSGGRGAQGERTVINKKESGGGGGGGGVGQKRSYASNSQISEDVLSNLRIYI